MMLCVSLYSLGSFCAALHGLSVSVWRHPNASPHSSRNAVFVVCPAPVPRNPAQDKQQQNLDEWIRQVRRELI